MARGVLLGLAMAVCGSAAAQPPGLQPNPRVEGRELDPVARDFHLTPEPATPRAEHTAASAGVLGATLARVGEAIAAGLR